MARTSSATMKSAWPSRLAAGWRKPPARCARRRGRHDGKFAATLFSLGRAGQPGRADYFVRAVGNGIGAAASGRLVGGAESGAAADSLYGVYKRDIYTLQWT